MPSVEDVLKSRVRTSGIVQETYKIDDVTFEMYDVGGQRNERKKWIHCFANVTAIIFVAAISEYDQVLFEDNAVNRLDEAVQLWEEIYTNRWFKNTAFILFLNKKDLFEEKLKRVDIRHPGDAHHAPRFLDYTRAWIVRTRSWRLFDPSVFCCSMEQDPACAPQALLNPSPARAPRLRRRNAHRGVDAGAVPQHPRQGDRVHAEPLHVQRGPGQPSRAWLGVCARGSFVLARSPLSFDSVA